MLNDNKPKEKSQTPHLFAVYVMWCSTTNMHYVGVTGQNVHVRILQHGRGNQFVDKEIRRTGWEHWDWWVIEENVPSELISEREQHWVAVFNSVYPNGYNKTIGGIAHFNHSEKTKAKMRNRKLTEEHKVKIRKKLTGRKLTKEHKAKLGKLHSGRKLTEEHKAKLRAKALARNISGENHPMYGKHHTEESKTLIREKALERYVNEENHPMYGKHHTEESKALIREKALERDVSGENNPFYGKHHTAESNDEKNRQAHLGRTPWNKGKTMSEEMKAGMRAKRAATIAAKKAADESSK